MMKSSVIRRDAEWIIEEALRDAMPQSAVKKALENMPEYKGRLYLVSAGKAAWEMAAAAHSVLAGQIEKGIVVTKYGHSRGNLDGVEVYEAGHPISDANSYMATEKVIEMTKNFENDDLILFLLSGGGSALFEKPLLPADELEDINRQLLACGADITEMNTLRKRFSAVKGGKFAKLCEPAKIYTIVLSDIIGDPLDMIASGPAYADSSTSEDAIAIANKYQLKLSEQAWQLLKEETPKKLDNVQTAVTGSVRQLCESASLTAKKLGYEPVILSASLCCEAREAGSFLASIAQFYEKSEKSLAFIAGGETVVHLKGRGLGGRNQELALSAAKGISGLSDVLIFSVGSDGTDGPTDAAGGIVDGETRRLLEEKEISIDEVLADNDAYHALKAVDGLIVTGPTGTNVNDLSVLLIRRAE